MSTVSTPVRRVSSRKTAPPSLNIPLPSTPTDSSTPLADISPRRRRSRPMRLRDPGHCGLYTLCEADEQMSQFDDTDDEYDFPPSPTPSRPPSWWTTDSHATSSADSHCPATPVSELDDIFFDSPTGQDKRVRAARPPPLNLAYSLSAVGPMRSPYSPAMYSPLGSQYARPPRVSPSSPSPLPRTPVTASLLPPLPILDDDEWSAQAPPSPVTPSTPMTPKTPGIAVNLVSALRELLHTCGEHDVCDDMFADADEDGEDTTMTPGCSCTSPGQFADADGDVDIDSISPLPSPMVDVSATQLGPVTPAHARGLRAPTPGAPRISRRARPKNHSVFVSDHARLRHLQLAPEPYPHLTRVPSLPSLSSTSSLSSTASSLASLDSMCGLAAFADAPLSPTGSWGSASDCSAAVCAKSASPSPRKRVSSRKPLQPLPPAWTRL